MCVRFGQVLIKPFCQRFFICESVGGRVSSQRLCWSVVSPVLVSTQRMPSHKKQFPAASPIGGSVTAHTTIEA
ncbi:hypothetical protein CCHR01_07752 [Colletotrichum chrysophilum]|uniref:Uncharacterized protein n=1 Tax=Colletotrichum chrysophilum TaxID=1836956 RepID=A0AAD9EII1_9PEZI|nr:hypothetical protein CCHR01_07752 [Colletotrichum chrysophilum]